MLKNKIFVATGLILLLAGITSNEVFAAENEVASESATFEAESPENVEIANLKSELANLQSELSSMKNGMQDLQAKVLESEIEKLNEQLAEIRGTNSSTSATTNTTSNLNSALLSTDLLDAVSNSNATDSDSEKSTEPEVTRIEDFVGFEVGDEVSAAENSDETSAEKSNEVDDALTAADAEIAKLEKLLAKKTELAADESAHAEVAAKIENLKAARAELAKISVADAVAAAENAEAAKPSSIIAQSDDEVLFQFPRAILQKANGSEPTDAEVAAGNLSADLLSATNSENDFERSSAPRKNWNIFSATHLAIFGGALAVALVFFVIWLVHNERKLLAATNRRFSQLEFKPDFDLKSRAKNSRGKNIIE